MKKICVINVYFGKYPNYFHLWLHSVKQNPTIDFLLVTDQQLSDLPKNVKTLPMDLEGFSKRASETIKLPIKLKSAYKCCDFKVAYGLMFEQELKDYDFWGHCDVDLIWGNLRKFLTENVLNEYDKIYPLGHLALYRNTDKMNRAFMLPGSLKGNYREILTSDKNFALDELGGIYTILKQNNIPQYEHYDFADISPVYKRMKIVTEYVKYDNNYKHQIFVVQDGKILRYYIDDNGNVDAEEFAYLHLQKRKFKDSEVRINPGDAYIVTPKGFKNVNSDITMKIITSNNRYYGRFAERLELSYWRRIKSR